MIQETYEHHGKGYIPDSPVYLLSNLHEQRLGGCGKLPIDWSSQTVIQLFMLNAWPDGHVRVFSSNSGTVELPDFTLQIT